MQLSGGSFGGHQAPLNPGVGPPGTPAGPHGGPPTTGAPPAPTPGVSTLPLPPNQYIMMYTDDNVKRGKAPPPPSIIRDAYSVFSGKESVHSHRPDLVIGPRSRDNGS